MSKRELSKSARTMNSDEYGYKPEEEWKIYFHDFKRFYDELDEDIEAVENDADEDYKNYNKRSMRINNLYYNRTFSYEEKTDDPTQRVRADYTFLHDWFGDNFRYMYSEENAPYDDIVKVECTPYGMVHWALQYSDRVEVVEPQEVREAVIEKVKNLNEKYGIKCACNEPVEEEL